MSYNESLNPNSNYPAMTQSQWDAAPFNEPIIPEREFNVCAMQTLVKETIISTDQYQPEYDEEDGYTYANTENTDWQDAYEKVACTPSQLIEVCGKLAQHLINDGIKKVDGIWLPRIVKECDGWDVDETKVEEL
jgi:hypothetical protein